MFKRLSWILSDTRAAGVFDSEYTLFETENKVKIRIDGGRLIGTAPSRDEAKRQTQFIHNRQIADCIEIPFVKIPIEGDFWTFPYAITLVDEEFKIVKVDTQEVVASLSSFDDAKQHIIDLYVLGKGA